MEPYTQLLQRSLDPPAEGDASAELTLRLDALLARARQTWPDVQLAEEVFVRHIARRVSGADDLPAALDALRADELRLACACAQGDPEAHRVFEAHFIRPARVVIARESDVVEPEEFFQRLRERLLVATPDRPARIGAYSGKGKLANWVRIAAQRLLIDEYRKREAAPDEIPHDSSDPMDSVQAAGADPEIGVLKSTYREGFQEAFEAAFAKLSSRERTLLRYRYIDGLEVNQIAAVSGRHRVSVYRAIVKARESLLEHLRRDMAERLHVGSSQADSVFRLMRSQLDVSLSRLFRSKPED